MKKNPPPSGHTFAVLTTHDFAFLIRRGLCRSHVGQAEHISFAEMVDAVQLPSTHTTGKHVQPINFDTWPSNTLPNGGGRRMFVHRRRGPRSLFCDTSKILIQLNVVISNMSRALESCQNYPTHRHTHTPCNPANTFAVMRLGHPCMVHV